VGVRSLVGMVQAAWPFVSVVQVSEEAQHVEDWFFSTLQVNLPVPQLFWSANELALSPARVRAAQ
jgi:hypothetical protein